MRDFHTPGRSTAHGLSGMAATSHPFATLAAVDVLRGGGNAADAAVAACAVQCVVEPQSTGIGGDCFVLYAPAGGGEIVALNGSGWAPRAAEAERLRAQGLEKIPLTGPHCVTVPGAVNAWSRLLADHGTMGLDELLPPAIRYAEEGYPVFPRVALDWQTNLWKLELFEDTAAIYLPGGRPPRAGEVHRQPALAATLRRIAEKGRDAFYAGEVAEEIVACLRAQGGFHALEDFAEYASEYVPPIRTEYRGYEVWECPPNGQGVTALLGLNILSGFDLAALAPLGADRLHYEAEATRLAYRDRDALLADPAHARVPVEELLEPAYAEALRGRIQPEKALDPLPPAALAADAEGDTVYLCTVDRDGNACSFINSLRNGFGSGVAAPAAGVLLQNRGIDFNLEEGHPNCLGPRKRPRHTLMPGMLARGGRALMPFGVMGGDFQAVGQVHFLTNLLDYGMDLQEAIDLPRAFHFGGVLTLEKGIGGTAAGELALRGHRIEQARFPLGGGQAIWIDWERGVLTGGSDPRKDGTALGF